MFDINLKKLSINDCFLNQMIDLVLQKKSETTTIILKNIFIIKNKICQYFMHQKSLDRKEFILIHKQGIILKKNLNMISL